MLPRSVRRHTPPAFDLLLTISLVTGSISACSAAAGLHSPSPRSPATTGSTATATESAPGTATPGLIALDEHADATTVQVRIGEAVVVRLHSAYWSTPASSDPRVLSPDAKGGSSHNGTCPPGGGCGVSSAHFTARRPGIAHVTASRSSCGEAMRCSPGQGSYDVTLSVSG
ncbi:hypothetical protein NGB36_26505 [Streptomyces sp. RB6PN25]|uniref:Proteinase inhibitor I42 chagasin domain-containing protein n=1 Tax=Streptomyces humicola TaxID=2953240 RepID=A0ABT1Q5L1_9ACTN|nr:hypothetical protein [Streptomyces humicola]MCQ4084037.1 hypothetical protein [Streptomyces humicola]